MTTVVTKTGMERIARVAFNSTGATLDQLGGNCPVQAEGTVDAHRFYFRARGRGWQFHVAPTDAEIFDKPTLYLEGTYGSENDTFAAGWMGEHEALLLITHSIMLWRIWRELDDAWRAQGNGGAFQEWVENMAEDPKGTLQNAAREWLAK